MILPFTGRRRRRRRRRRRLGAVFNKLFYHKIS